MRTMRVVEEIMMRPNQCAPASSGWQAKIRLGYDMHKQRTLLTQVHEGPLCVQRPFFPEGEVNHTYLLHPPGGLVGNDGLDIELDVSAGAHALVTTPGATKAYRNVREASVIRQQFDVRGTLEWLPQEIILFDGSRLTSESTVNLSANARLVMWEIQCFGRSAGDLPFLNGDVRFRLKVADETRVLLQDHLVVTGGAPIMQAPWGLQGYPSTGVMMAYPADQTLCELASEQLAGSGISAAATLLDNLLVVRVLAQQAHIIRCAFVDVWRVIRPVLLNRPECLPRIWNT